MKTTTQRNPKQVADEAVELLRSLDTKCLRDPCPDNYEALADLLEPIIREAHHLNFLLQGWLTPNSEGMPTA